MQACSPQKICHRKSSLDWESIHYISLYRILLYELGTHQGRGTFAGVASLLFGNNFNKRAKEQVLLPEIWIFCQWYPQMSREVTTIVATGRSKSLPRTELPRSVYGTSSEIIKSCKQYSERTMQRAKGGRGISDAKATKSDSRDCIRHCRVRDTTNTRVTVTLPIAKGQQIQCQEFNPLIKGKLTNEIKPTKFWWKFTT